jgi:hypothetical protein
MLDRFGPLIPAPVVLNEDRLRGGMRRERDQIRRSRVVSALVVKLVRGCEDKRVARPRRGSVRLGNSRQIGDLRRNPARLRVSGYLEAHHVRRTARVDEATTPAA